MCTEILYHGKGGCDRWVKCLEQIPFHARGIGAFADVWQFGAVCFPVSMVVAQHIADKTLGRGGTTGGIDCRVVGGQRLDRRQFCARATQNKAGL